MKRCLMALFVFMANTMLFGNLVYGDQGIEDKIDIKDSIKLMTQPEISKILEINKHDNSMLVTFANINLKVGESGIVMRDLSSYQAIVASVVVVRLEGTKAVAKVLPFTQLAQPYLPTPNMTPEVGDIVIFRSFNNKAFLIAPNETTYKAIVEQYDFIEFVNSDLLMGFLNSQGKHDPTPKILPKACNEYGVGLVFIVGSQDIGVFNCQNVARIAKYKNTLTDTTTKSPFYTRTSFEGGGSLTYSLSSKKSKNYFLYYDEFLKD
ncbi:plasminogen-binding N-terminal domain-containing protein [Helicobacter trogontum]|uniref:plasminogen-binding N-terminal domain-containing protein n=1 Tax=Helicobacter trogontum TaxID=50960 RepID=UPI000CF0C5B5|nr:plasminogen-binding N-terminal domain-containing protein [Helicobacter trogontum]MCI5786443.1 plasminogen-binding N-terminal domain-containing protein [Helicobacter trogontum]MDY5185455.1 plasminogen-binding N-terminal domain-containing protein [Helicobacter trogontum]